MLHRLGRHFFTVDVEEHFQVSAFESVVQRGDWDKYPSRVVANTSRIIDLLDANGSKGTFFVLGWVAARHPTLVQHIVKRGHEVASHGFSHRRVYDLTAAEFRQDIRLAKQTLEEAGGIQIKGYRAPSFSITPGHDWAFEVLIEEGYTYDSSLFPIRRPGYGHPHAPPIPHVIQTAAGNICEFPLLTTTVAGIRVPAAGGAYFRHLPYGLTRRALREQSRALLPGMFYIHPWEVDVEQPRLRVSALTRVRHYGGLARTWPLLERLLREFKFCSIAVGLPDIMGQPEMGPAKQGRGT
jgi:polysaccharide deacetylase family protein (PEP-CTERM system associated)